MLTRYIFFILSIAYYFSLVTSNSSEISFNDDISIVRQRVLEQMIWPPANTTATVVQNALNLLKALNRSCYWPDINYHDKNIVVWETAKHMDRITIMLQALTMNGSSAQNNTQMRTAVHCALNVWLVNDWQNPNWWFNQINTPQQATAHLLMLGSDVTSFEVDKIKQISYRADWWNNPGVTGANLVWMIQAQLNRALATNNVSGVEQGFNRMWNDIAVLPLGGEGIQNDWSYHFHGYQILSGSYGASWAGDIFAFFLCSTGTQYQPSSDKLSIFANFLTKGDAWLIIGNQWTWQVKGREISRALSITNVEFKPQSVRALAEVIGSNQTKVDLMNFAARLDKQPNAPLLLGNKHFYTSDFQVHRRQNWTAAIKMQSIRTQPDECINGENQKAEHTGQGVLNLYTPNADAYYFIFPLLDWQAINGITVEHSIPLEPCHGGSFPLKKLAFVGGVTDNQYGLALMDTASHSLTVQRSWHFYDDAIVALATNLSLSASTIAWTTLASRLLPHGQVTVAFFNSTRITLSDGNYSFSYVKNSSSNVQWIHVGESNIAYLLQTQKQYHSVGIEVSTKTANYDIIGPYKYQVTGRTLTIWLNHGQGPYRLDYNYMILPNVQLESISTLVKQYEDEQLFQCQSTNDAFHGVIWPSLKRASFVLWKDVKTQLICQSPLFNVIFEVSDAGAYLFNEDSNSFTITASNPIRGSGEISIAVNRIGSGQGCTTSSPSNMNPSNTKVTLALPSSKELLGASVSVTCKK